MSSCTDSPRLSRIKGHYMVVVVVVVYNWNGLCHIRLLIMLVLLYVKVYASFLFTSPFGRATSARLVAAPVLRPY